MSELMLYNTLTRRKERFEPLGPGAVGMYSCGPTVYSHQHLGNMRAYVFADLVKRVLGYFGHDVNHIVNITDVGHLTDDADAGEDKMEEAARREGMTAWEVAAKWTAVFEEDLKRLHVLEPSRWCKATDHIPEQIEMIATLEAKGFTYTNRDGVYFDTSKEPHYGELARLDLESQETQERIEGVGDKRNPSDFALWKLSKADGNKRQMEWESPWGNGFPGWHIECSAMSSKYLGETFDIHTGGVDHIPVHHTNEIAQSENAFGVRPWVRYWLHGAWLMFDNEKMSKSKGTTVTLDDIVEHGIDSLAYRYFLLTAHYRQQMSLSDAALDGAQASYQRLVRHAIELRDSDESQGAAAMEGFKSRFDRALADDLNTPQALAVVWEAVRSNDLGAVEKWQLLSGFDVVLGLGLADANLLVPTIDAEIEAKIQEREAARAAKDYARSDEIRDELIADGIVLEDTPEGVRWRRG